MSEQSIRNLIEKIRDNSEWMDRLEKWKCNSPDLYWELGSAIEESLVEAGIAEDERTTHVDEQFTKLEKQVWPKGMKCVQKSYDIKYHFIDKKVWDTVKPLASTKQGFAVKRAATYLLHNFSQHKDKCNATPKQQAELIKVFSNSRLSDAKFREKHKEILGNPKGLPVAEIKENYGSVRDDLQDAIDGDENKRDELRKNIGDDRIEPLRWLLQLVKQKDMNEFKKMYRLKVKRSIEKNFNSKHNSLNKFYKELKNCLGDSEKIEKLHTIILPNELSEMNSKLGAIESEDKLDRYRARKEGLKDIFS